MDAEDGRTGHGLREGEKQGNMGQSVEMARDDKTGVAVIGGCDGLRLAPGKGVEFPRSLLQTEGVLGPLWIARTVATVHSGGTVSGPTLARHVLVSASSIRGSPPVCSPRNSQNLRVGHTNSWRDKCLSTG